MLIDPVAERPTTTQKLNPGASVDRREGQPPGDHAMGMVLVPAQQRLSCEVLVRAAAPLPPLDSRPYRPGASVALELPVCLSRRPSQQTSIHRRPSGAPTHDDLTKSELSMSCVLVRQCRRCRSTVKG